MSADPAPAAPARRRNRNWLWVFAVLAVLGALAVAINWAYNVGEPLTPERLQAAREQWQRSRPPDYDLEIERITTPESADGRGRMLVDHYDVKVRGGKVTTFLLNGKEPEPLFGPDGKRNVEEERRQRESYDISGLFDSIEELMEKDRRDGVKSFIRARFDKADGHVTLFTRQVNGRRAPHIQVKLKRVQA